MAGTFIIGEQKVRPGAYFNVQKNGGDATTSTINGVTAVVFRSDFGPLGKAVELSAQNGYKNTYGDGMTTDAIQEAFNGGANTVIACRLGEGGTEGHVILRNEDGEDVVKITNLYPGEMGLTVTVREKLTNKNIKECIIFNGESQFDKVEFAAGDDEVAALVAAFSESGKFSVQAVSGEVKGKIEIVSQKEFEKGTNPTITVADYSNAFELLEEYTFNTICVDTEDTSIHAMLQNFVKRIYEDGILALAVVAEKHTVDIDARISHAAAFNDDQMHYVLNAHIDEQGTEIDGYQTAARIAGMIGSYASNISLTHKVVDGFASLLERLKPSVITNAEQNGCIVLSMNSKKQVWIDSAINTLITPEASQDEGWKKIRRVKTRFELMRRANDVADYLVGAVDGDTNGIATVISQLNSVVKDMISEGKLQSGTVTESTAYPADVDYAFFDFDIVDKDSLEHIYMTYRFQFNTQTEE